MHVLLVVDSSVQLHLHSFHTSLLFATICMPHSSVIVIIDMHPTHISLTHGFQGKEHIVDVNDPCL